MFRSTPLQVLSVVNIAPGSGGAALMVLQIARTATKAIQPYLLLVSFISFDFLLVCLGEAIPEGHSKTGCVDIQAPLIPIARESVRWNSISRVEYENSERKFIRQLC